MLQSIVFRMAAILLVALLLSACDRAEETTVTPLPVTVAPQEIRHVDPAGAELLVAGNPSVVVLDIRTPAEFAEGHIAGAKNIDFNGDNFAAELNALDRDQTYLVHCGVGGRSTRSLAVFTDKGFKSVVHLDGGLKAWQEAGKPVQK